MAETNVPAYWRLTFDANGAMTNTDGAALIDNIGSSGTTDLFLMAHGWDTSKQDAESLYDAWFPLLRSVPDVPPGARCLGVFWPSIWFPDPTKPDQPAVAEAVTRGAPGAADAILSGEAITASLAKSMTPEAAGSLQEMGRIIDHGLEAVAAGTANPAEHEQSLDRFHRLLQEVFSAAGDATEDSGETSLLNSSDPKRDYQDLADTMGSAPEVGDTEGLGDIFGKVWNGAKDALRVGSYFQMKERAGTIGREGLGPFLEQLHLGLPQVRVHLIGHSFGARLVSCALAGMSSAGASPAASLTLLQGAFSHWAFAEATPFGKPGALSEFADRVHGPLVSTFTEADWAVGIWYPKASFLAGQDTEGTETIPRWAGMGGDGFQAVTPCEKLSLPLDPGIILKPGSFYRVDANSVITDTSQSAFAGAHSDIIHSPVASLAVAASRAKS